MPPEADEECAYPREATWLASMNAGDFLQERA